MPNAPLYFELDGEPKAVVLHRQDPKSWNREVLFPTVVIGQGQGAAYREVVLNWRLTLGVLRDLQSLVAEIEEKRRWT